MDILEYIKKNKDTLFKHGHLIAHKLMINNDCVNIGKYSDHIEKMTGYKLISAGQAGACVIDPSQVIGHQFNIKVPPYVRQQFIGIQGHNIKRVRRRLTKMFGLKRNAVVNIQPLFTCNECTDGDELYVINMSFDERLIVDTMIAGLNGHNDCVYAGYNKRYGKYLLSAYFKDRDSMKATFEDTLKINENNINLYQTVECDHKWCYRL